MRFFSSSWRGPFAVGAAFLTAVLLGHASPAAAETVQAGCMQDIAGFGLNCTANDVQISKATVLEIIDECEYPGDKTTFVADFEVVVTAKARYDIGLYFATDGDLNNDGAISQGPFPVNSGITSGCSVSTIGPENADFVDLDDFPTTGDSCGDITKGDNPLHAPITITAVCNDPDGDGFLNLPNCTSWRQSGANEMCGTPTDAFPGAPSKCRCDGDFQVDVPVPPAKLDVKKTAIPATINEPGAEVTFQVDVTNAGIDPNNGVTLNSIMDDIYGELMVPASGEIITNSCHSSMGATMAGGASSSCMFKAMVQGNAGDKHVNTVYATGLDQRKPPNKIEGDPALATVTIVNVNPTLEVTKTASTDSVSENGEEVTFTVTVKNTSVSSDPVTIGSLGDSVYGDLTAMGCADPGTIQPGDTYTCEFTVWLDAGVCTSGAPCSETNTVTASGSDDDGTPVSDSASATVTITNDPSSIDVSKTASRASVPESGANVTFTFTVTNTSFSDTVTINSISDDVFGDLNGQGDCVTPGDLAPRGGSWSCSVTEWIGGAPDDEHTNVFTASGVDDDGENVQGNASATVNYDDVPPAATVALKVSALVTYDVEVRNDSAADELTIGSIVDDHYKDLTDVNNLMIQSSTCASGIVLAKQGEAGDTYQCSFTAEPGCSPLANSATASVTDDDSAVAVTATSGTVSVSVSGLGACEAPTQ